jgi:hypothetical protein
MPYTYLVGWSQQDKFYYGARWAKDCDPSDLWISYFTSSKHVKDFRALYGEPDIVQVRKVFDDPQLCRLYEQKTLRRLNVLGKEKWLNKNINGLFLPAEKTEEHKRKISESLKGKRKGCVVWTKKSNPEYAQRVSNGLRGKSKSPEHIINMRKRPQDTMSLTCPHCRKHGDYKNMKRWHMDNCKHQSQRLQ